MALFFFLIHEVDELIVKGYGFFNENMEVLCIHKTESSWDLRLVPWRESKAEEVVIFWEKDLQKYFNVMEYIPLFKTIEEDKINEFLKLEPMDVERKGDTIWIG